MYSNLPPLIQDWLTNLQNRKLPMNIRYNYFNMINNAIKEMTAEVAKFQKEMDNQRR